MRFILDNVPAEGLQAFLARRNNNKSTALTVAASHGNTVILKELLYCSAMPILLLTTGDWCGVTVHRMLDQCAGARSCKTVS